MEVVYYLHHLYSAIRLNSIQYLKVEPGWDIASHRHPYFEFLYCVEGELDQWINGQLYPLRPGDCVVINPGLYHHTSRAGASTLLFDFHFDLEVTEVFDLFAGNAEPLLMRTREMPPGNRIDGWIGGFIADFGADMPPTAHPGQPGGAFGGMLSTARQLQIHSRIVEFIGILADVMGSVRQRTAPPSSLPLPQLQLAHEAAYYMESHATYGVRIQDIADRLNVHRAYLNVVFKKAYGVPPVVYLHQARIRAAKKLLQETEWSIEEIAEKLAFSSFGHFSRSFKRLTGLTPRAYRNHQRKAMADPLPVHPRSPNG